MFAAVALAAKRFASPFIPGAGQMSMSRFMIRNFSFFSSSNTPSCSFLDTRATTSRPSLVNCPRAMPKLPDVASNIVCPRVSFPETMASWTMCTAGLTLIEPANKFESNLPNTLRFLSPRSRPYSFFAHSLRSLVMSIRGVSLTTFTSPDFSSM